MKTINIRTDAATSSVPVLIPFQGGPHDDFADGEEVLIQLVNNDGERVGYPEIRTVIKTISADENQSAWYDAYIPTDR
ncbi:MAG: hypothetical protein V4594_21950 [Bacteroidota bacterium]